MTVNSSFVDFLEPLLRSGQIVFHHPPDLPGPTDRQAQPLIEAAYQTMCLEIAGLALPLDLATASAAAHVVWQASWFLASHAEEEAVLEQRIRLPGPPATAAQHLSADLFLRYLPQLYQRARARAPDDRLTELLTDLLCAWPLSGVLAPIAAGPRDACTFSDHPGLWLLYAERLAEQYRPAWVPQGSGRAYVELVWQELGRDLATLPTFAPEALVSDTTND